MVLGHLSNGSTTSASHRHGRVCKRQHKHVWRFEGDALPTVHPIAWRSAGSAQSSLRHHGRGQHTRHAAHHSRGSRSPRRWHKDHQHRRHGSHQRRRAEGNRVRTAEGRRELLYQLRFRGIVRDRTDRGKKYLLGSAVRLHENEGRFGVRHRQFGKYPRQQPERFIG